MPQRRLSLALLLVALVMGGCKDKEPTPPHVLQQIKRRQQEKLAEEQQKQEIAAKKKEEQGKQDIELSWPVPVRNAFYQLVQADFAQMHRAARAVAMQGLAAVPAMEHLLTMKRQSVKKRTFVSILLTEVQMFRVEPLIAYLASPRRPYLQRSAIQALARTGNPKALKALQTMRKALVDGANRPKEPIPAGEAEDDHKDHAFALSLGGGGDHEGHGHSAGPSAAAAEGQNPYQPLIDFIDGALAAPGAWGYDDGQLLILDRIFHAPTPEELTTAMEWIKDLTLEQGLLAMVQSPATRPPVRGLVTRRLLTLARDQPKHLVAYVHPSMPQPFRAMAVDALVELGEPKYIDFIKKALSSPDDPLVGYLRKKLAGADNTP